MDLLDKYNELKRAKSESVDVVELKRKIDSLNQMDNETVMQAVGQAMLRFFSDNYSEADKRHQSTVKGITEQLGQMIVNAAKVNKQNINDSSKELVKSVEKAVESLNQAISNIPQTDLSGIDASIKGIKPTDVTNLEMQVANLTNEIAKLSKKKPTKKDVDLTPIIEELSKPVNVDFSIEYDQWDYPVKIKAKEIK